MITRIDIDDRRPLLVFGGPYSNVRAAQALRARAAVLGVAAGQTICTGDVVAYCAEPEATVAAIRAWGCHVIAGNCEQQLATSADDCGCGFAAGTACQAASADWYAYASARISPSSRAWMSELPSQLMFSYAGKRVRVIHGGVRQINRFVFASDNAVIAEELAAAAADLVIAGHAGLPFASVHKGRTWLNPGVIGMPANDGTTDGWYGLIEPVGAGLRLTVHRLAYDHGAASAATARAGHAPGYARGLATGIWPSHDVLPSAERAVTGIALAEFDVTV